MPRRKSCTKKLGKGGVLELERVLGNYIFRVTFV